ncbi:MAG: flagellar protein FlgN [Proteobacteria bacterium]|nr:flagellar protein FlgN [Pseudomonadota bacterium]|tara:strand:- start:31 stop:450 length:420 start_codon:yes stop_codon:yes gene_type:complete
MDRKELLEAVGSANRLYQLLNDEFEALKQQNLDLFERIQKEKVEIIHRLSTFSPKKDNQNFSDNQIAHPADAEWDELMELMKACKELHLRNEILINRKLDATKGALQALHLEEPTSSVEVYDRLGKISRGGKKSGYEEV